MPGSADRWIMLSFATWPNHSRQMPHRNLPTLNAVVSGFSQRGFFKEAFLLFKDMIFCEFRPNSISVASALRGCNSFELCALLHCLSLKIVVVEDVYVATSFFTMYLNCAEVVLAKRVFDEVNNKCVVSYNAYVSGLLRNGLSGLVLDVFKDRMRFSDEKSNSVALVCVLSACASVLYQKLGMEVHGVVMKTNLCCDTMVGNALTDMCSHVVQFLVLYGKLKWRPMVIPDSYIDHGSPVDRLMQAGLTPSHIAATVFNILVQRREASDITTMHVM